MTQFHWVFFSCFIIAQLDEFKKKQDQPQNCDGYVKKLLIKFGETFIFALFFAKDLCVTR